MLKWYVYICVHACNLYNTIFTAAPWKSWYSTVNTITYHGIRTIKPFNILVLTNNGRLFIPILIGFLPIFLNNTTRESIKKKKSRILTRNFGIKKEIALPARIIIILDSPSYLLLEYVCHMWCHIHSLIIVATLLNKLLINYL